MCANMTTRASAGSEIYLGAWSPNITNGSHDPDQALFRDGLSFVS